MIEYDEQYYRQYFAKNFNAELLPGFGIEDCLDWAASCFVGQRWLDVGAGPTTFFWATAAPASLQSLWIADHSGIPLTISVELAQSRQWPAAYRQALVYLGRPTDHLDRIADIGLKTAKFDAFSAWPDLPRFDSVSAFGLLGLATTEREMNTLVASARGILSETGTFFGASWVFADRYTKRLGGRVQKIKSIEPTLRDYFAHVAVREVAIKDDDYSSIVLFRADCGGAS
jgi:hypothetical protein